MSKFYPFGAQTYTLGTSIGSTDTSILLSSFTEPVTGTPYTMALLNTDIVFGTIAPKTTSSEFISFTGITQNANGTATLTGVTRGLAKKYPLTADSAYKLPHSGQTQFIISDVPQLYQEYVSTVNDVTISGLITFLQNPVGINPGGVPDSSTTVKGIGKISVAPVLSTNPIFVGDNDPRVANPLTVAYGGTGLQTLTAHALQVGNGTSTPTQLGLGTSVQVLHGNASGDPTFGAVVLTTDVSGVLPIANGGTGSATGAVASYVSALTTSSSSTNQNIDTAFTTNFAPSTITIYYKLQGFQSSASQTSQGIAVYNSAGTLILNQAYVVNGNGTTTAITQGTMAFSATAPVGGGNGGNNQIQVNISITAVSSTSFTVRIAYTNVGGGPTGTSSFVAVATA